MIPVFTAFGKYFHPYLQKNLLFSPNFQKAYRFTSIPDGSVQVVREQGNAERNAVLHHILQGFPLENASKTRRASIPDGSVQVVREQGNAERNAVLRRILQENYHLPSPPYFL